MALFKKETPENPEKLSYRELKKEIKKAQKEGAEIKKKEPRNFKEEYEQCKKIHAERKVLRKDLKQQGIKKYSEYDMFATEVELAYPEKTGHAFSAKVMSRLSQLWYTFWASFNVIKALLLFAIILGVILLVAYLSVVRGRFTVNITADMLKNGFQLSEAGDFSEDKTRLYAAELQNSNATSVYEINRQIYKKDGANNGPGYVSYTFYLKNNGTEPTDYAYTVNILSETLGTASAVWLMFFEDDRQIIYAREQDPETHKPESLYGYPDAPFMDCAYDADSQYFYEDGSWGITTTPFIDEGTALQGYVEQIEPGEVKKYTMVIWIEGDDPDCNNSILGGHVGFNVQFDRLGEDPEDFFKGIFRREYDVTYQGGTPTDDKDTSDAGTGQFGN